MCGAIVGRIQLQNYRSIARCDVTLEPLTFLVGSNGSGKSNFLDALRFVTQSLQQSLEHAMRDRGGINEVRRRSGGHPNHFGIGMDLRLPTGDAVRYAFRVGAQKDRGYVVLREECHSGLHWFKVEDGEVSSSLDSVMPPASLDRLYLVSASGLPVFRPVYESLVSMAFLNPVPDRVRRPQEPDPGERLERDGGNLVAIFERAAQDGDVRGRIQEYLTRIVPGLEAVDVKRALGLQTLEFRQQMEGAKHPWKFKALSMSDGTLRALAVLVALFHRPEPASNHPTLVGLEEPEMALHPAAAGVLFDALVESSGARQVIVTTHSPDLIDRQDVDTRQLRAVRVQQGRSYVGPVDEAGRRMLREQLYTPGELLRLAQLQPDPQQSDPPQLDLFPEETR